MKKFIIILIVLVILIIGGAIVLSFSTASTDKATTEARDSWRVNDIKQLQTALNLYWQDNHGYPAAGDGIILGNTGARSLTSKGFVDSAGEGDYVYMQTIRPDREPVGSGYVYASCNTSPCDNYAIEFTLENAYGNLSAGRHVASQLGIE